MEFYDYNIVEHIEMHDRTIRIQTVRARQLCYLRMWRKKRGHSRQSSHRKYSQKQKRKQIRRYYKMLVIGGRPDKVLPLPSWEMW